MKKILIVEDDQSLSEALQTRLGTEGFKVEVAINGKEGLEKIDQFKPDLILLDIIMPIMDGITMLKEIKKRAIKTPVIILTNLTEGEVVGEALESGSYNFLVKSNYSLSDIFDKIKEVLK